MQSATMVTVFILCALCALVYPTIGMSDMVHGDFVYFPDQADYIKLASKCPDNQILWPSTRRCYREGEQGPCNIGRVLLFNRRLLKPYCKDIVL